MRIRVPMREIHRAVLIAQRAKHRIRLEPKRAFVNELCECRIAHNLCLMACKNRAQQAPLHPNHAFEIDGLAGIERRLLRDKFCLLLCRQRIRQIAY